MTITTDPHRPRPHMRLVRAIQCAPIRRRRRARRGRVAPLGAATATAARASLGATGPGRRWWWTDAAIWALALTAHAVVAVAVWRTRVAPPVSPRSTRITVQVHAAAPPSRPAAATPIAAPRPSVPRAVPREALRAPRAPLPIAAPPPAPVKVVGLSLESTSETAQGPTFAVGGTLAGTTSTTAAPVTTRPPPTAEPPAGPNRAARGLPRPGSVLTPPRRLREVKPRYPDARRASGLEADVLLVVSLDAAGHVLSVTVGRSSHDDTFDDSALQAAREERFSPALRDGVPVATTFSFTTHFRLDTP